MNYKIINALEKNGVGFDWDKYSSELLSKKYSDEKLLIDEISTKLHCNSDDVKDPKKLIWKLYNNKFYPESLSLEYLKNNKDDNEIYNLLYKYKCLKIFLNQYGTKLKQQIHNGRIYADWTIDGAVTGRMTCKNPNLQAFPKELKQYFKPNKGNCFVSGDYSQIELRVLAELSKDGNLINVLSSGADIHITTASLIFNKPIDLITDEERTIGKKINFGMCYGISNYGLFKTINKYTDNITLDKADVMKHNFYKSYPKVRQYHNHLLTTNKIVSLGGKEWLNYKKGISRINLPVQSSASEGLKFALSILMGKLTENWLLVNVIHDEIILEVPISKSKETEELLKNCMIEGMGKIVKSVPIIVNTEIRN